jgi:hypothetical protein
MENLANRTHVEESELSEAMSSHRREKVVDRSFEWSEWTWMPVDTGIAIVLTKAGETNMTITTQARRSMQQKKIY